jgi:hypothetical protein
VDLTGNLLLLRHTPLALGVELCLQGLDHYLRRTPAPVVVSPAEVSSVTYQEHLRFLTDTLPCREADVLSEFPRPGD